MNYFFLTLRHKWFVLLAGLKTQAPLWRLLIHDWSKFTPAEYFGYQRHFFSMKGSSPNITGFNRAWLHHIHHNPHHWEHWIIPEKRAVPMPERAVREMVADWMAAGRAYEGKWPEKHNWKWLVENRHEMNLSFVTDATLDSVLKELGYTFD